VAGCSSSGDGATPASGSSTVTATVTVSTTTVTVTPNPPATTSSPTSTGAPAPAPRPIPTPTTPTTATTTTGSASTASVVEAYYAAINAHDYQTAWNLLGNTGTGSGYTTFVNGFADTAHDTLTITGVSGDTVSMHLDAQQTDGTHKQFAGTYTVRNGRIAGAHVEAVSSGPIVRPGAFCSDADLGKTAHDANGQLRTCVMESGEGHWH
jgi:eukaryotic-like serine/threonine-protein kinase